MVKSDLTVSAPGRICLFGEHQDYLGLSIIAAAIDLRISICGKKRKDKKLRINLPDTGERLEFSLENNIVYTKERDYLRSAVNILKRKGIILDRGWDCTIKGNIPINSGTASSSALVVAWVKFLLEATRNSNSFNAAEIAELGFLAEVAEFNEPGGRMDQYVSSLGGVVAIDFGKKLKTRKFKNPLGKFVLADSLQKKDTTGMLDYIKTNVIKGMGSQRKEMADFSLKTPLSREVIKGMKRLPSEQQRLLKGILITRDITSEGKSLFESRCFDHKRFGKLLTHQHKILRDDLKVSTPKIDRMIESSIQAGALGAKINGSGGGGCMFAYAPENPERVARSLQELGAITYIVQVDEGVRTEASEQ